MSQTAFIVAVEITPSFNKVRHSLIFTDK